MTTEQPATKLQLGDPAEWVDRYGDELMRFACRRVGRRDVAEDLVQETFLAAYKARYEFDRRAQLSTWLVAILRRKIVDHYRRSARTPETAQSDLSPEPFDSRGRWKESLPAWDGSPAELAENAEFWEVLRDCLGRLPAHLAQAFEIRELGMASVDSACEAIGVSAKNLAVRLHRSRLLLRECLERKWFRGDVGERP